jgi:hypothetical protein
MIKVTVLIKRCWTILKKIFELITPDSSGILVLAGPEISGYAGTRYSEWRDKRLFWKMDNVVLKKINVLF